MKNNYKNYVVIIKRKIVVGNILGDKYANRSLTLLRNGIIQIWHFMWNTVTVFWKPKIFAFAKNTLAIYAHSQTRSKFTDIFNRRTLPVWTIIHFLFSLNWASFGGTDQVLFSYFLAAWISSCKDLVWRQVAQVTGCNCMLCHCFHSSRGKLFILLLNVVRFAL